MISLPSAYFLNSYYLNVDIPRLTLQIFQHFSLSYLCQNVLLYWKFPPFYLSPLFFQFCNHIINFKDSLIASEFFYSITFLFHRHNDFSYIQTLVCSSQFSSLHMISISSRFLFFWLFGLFFLLEVFLKWIVTIWPYL